MYQTLIQYLKYFNSNSNRKYLIETVSIADRVVFHKYSLSTLKLTISLDVMFNSTNIYNINKCFFYRILSKILLFSLYACWEQS